MFEWFFKNKNNEDEGVINITMTIEQYEDLKKIKTELQVQLKEKDAELTELTNKLEDFNFDNNLKVKELRKVSKIKNDLEIDNIELFNKNNQLIKEIENLSMYLGEFETENDELNSRVKELQKKVKQLELISKN